MFYSFADPWAPVFETSYMHPTVALMRIGRLVDLLLHVWSKSVDALDDLVTLDSYHLSEQCLGTF